jgi:hypothetical protein
MSEIIGVPTCIKSEITRIGKSTDSEELLRELKESLQITVNHVIKLAAIVRRLEDLGVSVSFDFSWLPFIRRIAYGQLHPKLFVSLQGDHTFLNQVASLPIPDQVKVAENEPFRVMQIGGDHRLVSPLSMTRIERKQVFAQGRIRSDGEQIGWLLERDSQPKHVQDSTASEAIVVDRKRSGIVVSGKFISATDLAHYLTELTVRNGQRKSREAVGA